MNPVCFYIGHRPIYWYGLMVATAFLACMTHLALLGKKEGRSTAFVSDLGFWIMLAGILGARLAYVLANWREFAAAPGMVFRIDQGGLIYYGGFIGAGLAAILFARVKQEPWWPLADYLATALPLGHAIGRIGCFLNGCCYGTPSHLPWSVSVDGELRHPVQLYEALANFILYGILLWVYLPRRSLRSLGHRRKRDGRVMALYLILYPLSRFVLECFRGDDRLRWLGLSAAQEISLLLIVIGGLLWLWLPRPPATGLRPSQLP